MLEEAQRLLDPLVRLGDRLERLAISAPESGRRLARIVNESGLQQSSELAIAQIPAVCPHLLPEWDDCQRSTSLSSTPSESSDEPQEASPSPGFGSIAAAYSESEEDPFAEFAPEYARLNATPSVMRPQPPTPPVPTEAERQRQRQIDRERQLREERRWLDLSSAQENAERRREIWGERVARRLAASMRMALPRPYAPSEVAEQEIVDRLMDRALGAPLAKPAQSPPPEQPPQDHGDGDEDEDSLVEDDSAPRSSAPPVEDDQGDAPSAEPSRQKDTYHAECAICLESDRKIAFNCGHLATCAECSALVKKCPICRVRITQRLEIFIS